MKYKPKNIKSGLLIVAVIAVLIVAANHLGIGTPRSAVRIGYIGNEGWRSWSARYAKLDGRLSHAIHPKDTQTTLRLEIVTEEGLISIEVKDSEGKVIFDDDNIGTASFDVCISGKVVVRIEAHDHKGSFSIKATE